MVKLETKITVIRGQLLMNRIVISTIGTSLLTNQINRTNPEEKNWYDLLRDTANLTLEETPKEVLAIIEILSQRAIDKLNQSSIKQIRLASAELNGVYGLYQENLKGGSQDMHWLIATDTAQGKTTAKIVEAFLQSNNIATQMYTPKGLSTASTKSFSDGIDDLLVQLEEIVKGYSKVIFNLVGGFKSLQGYLNTIGMFYAHEIIYIFEGQGSEVITIPRLPIIINTSAITPYGVQFALMSIGSVKLSEIQGLPEGLIYVVDDEVTLSNWGRLVWNKAKGEILSDKLLNFPRIKYEKSFRRDYDNIRDSSEKVKLQESLAKASYLLENSQGDRSSLRKDGGLQLETYRNTDIDHFRVDLSQRVSCKSDNNNLYLRYYGTHAHVERSEQLT